MLKMLKTSFFAIFCLNLTACGTISSLTADGGLSVYSGTRQDFATLQEGGLLAVFATIDLPFSFVLDTLLLPVTLAK